MLVQSREAITSGQLMVFGIWVIGKWTAEFSLLSPQRTGLHVQANRNPFCDDQSPGNRVGERQ